MDICHLGGSSFSLREFSPVASFPPIPLDQMQQADAPLPLCHMDKEGIPQQGQSQGGSSVWVDLAVTLRYSLRDGP